MAVTKMKTLKGILSGSILLLIFVGCLKKVDKPCIYTIHGKNNKSVYVHKWNWGLNGNNQYIVISSIELQSKEQANLKRDYLYEGEFPIFLKLEKDSILIFTYKEAINPIYPISTQFHIRQIEIDNVVNQRLREDSLYVNLEKICSK